MAQLFLVKHALPEIKPDVPAKTWRLGERGRAQSALLAEALRPYRPGVVITSDEPKAAETGQVVADVLLLPCRAAPNLHENDRSGFPYFEDLDDLEAALRTFFDQPDERVIGRESAHEAQQRFVRAVKEVLEPHPEQDAVLVAHGTVNTLLAAAHNPVAPFTLWRAWPLAGFAVLSRPDFGLLEGPLPRSD